MGNNGHRLRLDDPYNTKEIAFVAQINQELGYNSMLLNQIVDHTGKTYLDEEKERLIVSVIQWLGSPVGQGFLAQVEKRIDNDNSDMLENSDFVVIDEIDKD